MSSAFVRPIFALDTSAFANEESTPGFNPFFARVTTTILKEFARSRFFCCDILNRCAPRRFRYALATRTSCWNFSCSRSLLSRATSASATLVRYLTLPKVKKSQLTFATYNAPKAAFQLWLGNTGPEEPALNPRLAYKGPNDPLAVPYACWAPTLKSGRYSDEASLAEACDDRR